MDSMNEKNTLKSFGENKNMNASDIDISWTKQRADELLEKESQQLLDRHLKSLGLSIEPNKTLKPIGLIDSQFSKKDLVLSVNRLYKPKKYFKVQTQRNHYTRKKSKNGKIRLFSNAPSIENTPMSKPKRTQTSRKLLKIPTVDDFCPEDFLQTEQTARASISTDQSNLPTEPTLRTVNRTKTKSSMKEIDEKSRTATEIKSPTIISNRPQSLMANSIDLDTKDASELGDLFMIMSKRKIISPKENARERSSLKSLNEKIIEMMMQNPSELYRILSHTSKDPKNKELEQWTEGHESLFRSLLRKTHSFNSISKTKMFKEKANGLPSTGTALNMDWRFDKHSPWVNDLDCQDNKLSARKSISNIRTQILHEPTTQQKEEDLICDLQKITGCDSTDLYKLKKLNTKIQNLKEFEDAMKGFEQIYLWEKSQELFDTAKNILAQHILQENENEVKNLNRSRYSYLSAKVAFQRANKELRDKMLQRAEIRRQELRKKQKDILRNVIIAKNIVRRIYGHIIFRPKRVLINTSHPINTPLFIPDMIKLGFLPTFFEAKPNILNPENTFVVKDAPFHLAKKSLDNLSKWNKIKEENIDSTKNIKIQLDKYKAAIKIQAHIRGFLFRTRIQKLKKVVNSIKSKFRMYKDKYKFMQEIICYQKINGTQDIVHLVRKWRSTLVYQKALRDYLKANPSLATEHKAPERIRGGGRKATVLSKYLIPHSELSKNYSHRKTINSKASDNLSRMPSYTF
ncbi:unnamed protein product [Blepharisma stoltei]|uniref:Uncharacterized protein n=1 Tax=Blepharisma stoltei TaxID=1481888 RepID=A0AAU9KDU6_9CILI|nr:unnamed protein product [Blepharisma stoltei]